MKKTFCLLIIFFLMFLLVGCQKEIKKFSLEDKYYNSEELIVYEDYSKISSLINDKENFVLYIYLDGCSTCHDTKIILEEYLTDKKIMVYGLNYDAMEKGSQLKKTIEYAPSVVLIEKGKIVKFLDTSSDEDTFAFKDIDGFSKWFETYIELK